MYLILKVSAWNNQSNTFEICQWCCLLLINSCRQVERWTESTVHSYVHFIYICFKTKLFVCCLIKFFIFTDLVKSVVSLLFLVCFVLQGYDRKQIREIRQMPFEGSSSYYSDREEKMQFTHKAKTRFNVVVLLRISHAYS